MNRRTFLRVAGAVVVGAALPVGLVPARPRDPGSNWLMASKVGDDRYGLFFRAPDNVSIVGTIIRVEKGGEVGFMENRFDRLVLCEADTLNLTICLTDPKDPDFVDIQLVKM